MSNLIFRGVTIRYLDRRKKESVHFLRAHLSCDPTEQLAEDMAWQWNNGILPDGQKNGDLEGSVIIGEMTLTPPAGLEQHEIQMLAEEVTDFQVVKQKSEGGAEYEQLRFILKTSAPVAMQWWDNYWRLIGDGAGTLSCVRQGEPQQQTIDGTVHPSVGPQLSLDDVPADDAEETAAERGGEEQEPVPAPVLKEMRQQRRSRSGSLASAREVQ